MGVITMIMIIITTTATISLIIMIIKLKSKRHHWQASTSLEAHVRDLDSKEEVDSFNGFVEIVEGGRRSVHIVWSLTQKKSSRLFEASNHASTQGVPALYNC